MRLIELPVITDQDRTEHPYNSDIGIMGLVVINKLEDWEIHDILDKKENSEIFEYIKALFANIKDARWVSHKLFVVNTAKEIAVKRGIMEEKDAIKYWNK